MEQSSLLDDMLSKGIALTVDEFKMDYVNNLKERLMSMIESKEDPKIILKNLIEYLEKERLNVLYAKRGW